MPGLVSGNFKGDGNRNTEKFGFVDGSEEGLDSFAEPFKLPWRSDQPNGLGCDQDCIV